ncbi:MAG TPA: DUF4258 domain-containing protein [Chitinophagaceae bacterium]|jgi:hypothetical protein|nr:DUF4258 domain-containing protein [Chitinophagaceae bacterium]
MKKAIPLLILVVLAVAIFLIKHVNPSSSKNKTVADRQVSPDDVNRDRGFDRRVSYLQYSNHAKCRMQCRHITTEEVEETMREGKINYNKSDIQNAHCPRYAVEDLTRDNQRVRIVFAQCNNYTEVVTVIDLDTEWTCDCPGDDDKYKNRN